MSELENSSTAELEKSAGMDYTELFLQMPLQVVLVPAFHCDLHDHWVHPNPTYHAGLCACHDGDDQGQW